jgi:hypothetical protein
MQSALAARSTQVSTLSACLQTAAFVACETTLVMTRRRTEQRLMQLSKLAACEPPAGKSKATCVVHLLFLSVPAESIATASGAAREGARSTLCAFHDH